MKFIFWQNIVSPHQSFFLRNLSENHNVILVAETIMDEDRLKQGWEIPNLGKTQIILINDTDSVNELLHRSKEYHHIFSGINSYPLINTVFKKIIKNQKVNIISESCIELGFKKWIRFWKYRYLAFRYNSNINNIFAMGDVGVNWYKKTGFIPNKIHKFQYTIELPEDSHLHFQVSDKNENFYRFTFIGQLIARKGIDNLITALSKVKSKNWHLNIIGDGIMKSQIFDMISASELNDKVTFYGNKDNQDAMSFLRDNTDYLILPSRFDGWGAVVNEALARGVKVITNEKCGASSMIKDDFWGVKYKEGYEQSLVNVLEAILKEKKKFTFEERIKLSQFYKIENQDKVVLNFINKFI